MSRKNLEVIEALYAAWLRSEESPFDANGHEGFREYMRAVFEAFTLY